MKKFLALPMAAALLIGLAACSPGGNTGDAEGTPELVIWVDALREPAAQAYKDSVAGEVDVQIEVIDQTQVASKIELFNTTNSGWPDIIYTLPYNIAGLQTPTNGYAANLSELVEPAVLDGYQGANDWCLIDGAYYCLKNDLGHSLLWYDTVIFEELGLTIPTTMTEWAATAMELEGTGYSAGAIGDVNFYSSYLWPSECPMANVVDGTTVNINPDASECTRVAELVQPLVDAGVLDTRSSFDAGFMADVAQAGKVAMTLAPSWWGENVMRNEGAWNIAPGRTAAAPMPIFEGADEAWSGAYGGGIWVVSSHSKFPETAADAATFMGTSIETMTVSPAFPAYAPAREAWAARISADPFYAEDVMPVLEAQALLISTSEASVRYDIIGQVGAVLQTEITAGTDIATAIREFQEALIQLAPGTGYTVVSK